MGASASVKGRTMAPRTNTGLIGSFFEAGLAKLLNCEISELGNPLYADIYNGDLSFRAEVKARDHGHPIGLRLKQLRFYLENKLPVPEDFNHTLYALVTYKRELDWKEEKKSKTKPNGRSVHYVSRLAQLESEVEKCKLLASSWRSVYLIDIEVIRAMELYLGLSKGTHPGNHKEREVVIDQGRAPVLPKLFCRDRFADTLRTLSLSASEWRGSERRINLDFRFPPKGDDEAEGGDHSYSASFKLVTVLQKDLHSGVTRLFRSRTLSLV